ncbi:TIGR01777 family oxidoreductase [Agaribacterium sp. ZY112]|uniref:TIGR01777 family oxidoreductase n=1 Tax=Agaribacterium sp. ZY112 TaxID=3233574 RepID=UPI0035235886
MNILISGGTGFIGRALCKQLVKNHTLLIKTRYTKAPKCLSEQDEIHFIQDLTELPDTYKCDVAINLAGEPIADKRWSNAQKQELLRSRVSSTQEFIDLFIRLKQKPEVFISGSAIGYYGIDSCDQAINEEGRNDHSFSSYLCQQWEASALQATELGIRTCLLRTGIVLGHDGGALKKMLTPFSLGLGGKIGTGKQWMPWVHAIDLIGIIELCITNKQLSGPVNGTAPKPVNNSEFTHALAHSLKRPSFFTTPSFVIKLIFGQMGVELLLSGKKVIPEKAINNGYQFQYPTIEEALSKILKQGVALNKNQDK